jgi:hypothetical protein
MTEVEYLFVVAQEHFGVMALAGSCTRLPHLYQLHTTSLPPVSPLYKIISVHSALSYTAPAPTQLWVAVASL